MKVATRGAKGRASAEGEGAEDSRERKRREGGELQDACRFFPGFLRGLAALCFSPNGFRERDAALHARPAAQIPVFAVPARFSGSTSGPDLPGRPF